MTMFPEITTEEVQARIAEYREGIMRQTREIVIVKAFLELMLEELASLAQESWSGWMTHLFGKSQLNADGSITIPAAYVKNLQRQVDMTYAELPEDEKDSDRKEARKVLDIFSAHFMDGDGMAAGAVVSQGKAKQHRG